MNNVLSQLTEGFTFTGEIKNDAYEFLTYHGCKEVAEHSIKVALKAKELAEQFDVDKNSAEIAGYLHDIGRTIPQNSRINIAEELGIDILEEERIFQDLLHSKLSKVMASEIFKIENQDILNAIECHSTLRANVSKLDLVLFVADKLTWESDNSRPIIDGIMRGLEKSLEHGAFSYIQHLWNIRDELKVIHSWVVDAYYDLKDKCII